MDSSILFASGWVSESVMALLIRLGVVVQLVVERPSSSLSWWEWIWTWFGYSYTTTVHILDAWMVCLYLGLFMVIGIPLLCCCMYLIWFVTRTFLLRTLKMFRGAWSFYKGACTCVFRWLASKKDPGEVVGVVIEDGDLVVGVRPESIREGSNFTDFATPPFQGTIGVLESGVFRAKGCFVRINDAANQPWFAMPEHVWAGLPRDCHISGRSGAVSIDRETLSNSDGRARRVIYIDTDVVAVEATPGEASLAGLQTAKIHNGDGASSSFAKIVGPGGKGSVGSLRASDTLFGYYVYNGSTVGGFSGAAYVVHDRAIAIHSSGGAHNYGYSMRLIYVTLLYHLKMKPEDTSDFLFDSFINRKRRIRIDQSWGHPDTVRLQVDKQFHIMDAEKVRAAVGKGVELEGWLEPESDQGNFSSMPLSGGCASSTELTQAGTSDLQGLISGLSTLAKAVSGSSATATSTGKNSAGQKKPKPKKASATTSTTSPDPPPQ